MKEFHVEYLPSAAKALGKLDPAISRMIVLWVRRNLEGCVDPRVHGKALTANRAGQWRYRVGDYRLIAEIHDRAVTILILDVGRRSIVYQQ